MARLSQLLVWCALSTVLVSQDACALKLHEAAAQWLSNVSGRALGAAGSVGETAVREAEGFARNLVKDAASVAGRVSSELAGGFLELVGMSSTCAGEAAADCRQVVAELVEEYLDVGAVPLTPKGLYEALKKRIPVHPGTKWCGAGNVARHQDEPGVLEATDSCCRSHDGCPDNMAVGEERHGLENTATFTRSHCSCDDEFYDCLKAVNTLVSLKIGFIYFNILRPQCYKQTYPIIGCKSHAKLVVSLPHCNDYELDRSGKPFWQWFDSPLY